MFGLRAHGEDGRVGQLILDPNGEYANDNAQDAGSLRGIAGWHDTQLLSILTYLNRPGGMRLISRLLQYHEPTSTSDYADDIVADLRTGRLVIVDQSTGDPDMNKAAGEWLMWRVFNRQRDDFVNPTLNKATGEIIPPPDVIVYVEEAHNLLPAKSDDLTTV